MSVNLFPFLCLGEFAVLRWLTMHQMLKQAFGDSSLGQAQTHDWYKRFKNGPNMD
jgi:hypothetical protein